MNLTLALITVLSQVSGISDFKKYFARSNSTPPEILEQHVVTEPVVLSPSILFDYSETSSDLDESEAFETITELIFSTEITEPKSDATCTSMTIQDVTDTAVITTTALSDDCTKSTVIDISTVTSTVTVKCTSTLNIFNTFTYFRTFTKFIPETVFPSTRITPVSTITVSH